QRRRVAVEQLARLRAAVRAAGQWQVVGRVAGRAVEAEALGGLGDGIGNRQRILEDAAVLLVHAAAQALLHFPQGADEGGRIAAVHADRIETAAAQVLDETFQALEGTQLGALLDA